MGLPMSRQELDRLGDRLQQLLHSFLSARL